VSAGPQGQQQTTSGGGDGNATTGSGSA
jgi:hypothetical protein